MSWIKRHPLLAIAALAFSLRAAAAVVTEFKPIFPAYYYTDAALIGQDAADGLEAVEAGHPPILVGPLSQRIHLLMTLDVYRLFGPRALPVKLLNAALGAAGIAALVAAFALVFPWPAAAAAGVALSFWPSHVFYTSQNLKESPTHALAFCGLAAALALGTKMDAPPRRRAALAAAAVFALICAGFFRSYVLLCASAALGAAFGAEALRRRSRTAAFAAATAAAAAVLFLPASRGLYAALQRPGDASASISDEERARPSLLPVTVSASNAGVVYRPTSPEGLSGFRRTRQEADRSWAGYHMNREIGTQLFPDVTFHSWLDVLAFLPKGAFYVLFMPLPGLYPMDGKIGRIAAAAENLTLLGIALLAAAGLARGPLTAGRAALALYFAAMTAGAALLEFDLGSAGRHKLLYLPMLFPFAAEELFRLLGRKEPA